MARSDLSFPRASSTLEWYDRKGASGFPPHLIHDKMHSIATLSLALCTTVALAQPTLQYTEFPAVANLNWYVLVDPGVSTEPTDGTGQTWDFSSAVWTLAGTASIAPAAGTPYAAQFPAANFVFISTPTGQASVYAYLLVTAGGIEVICGDAPLNTEVYTNYKTILATPLAYGVSFSDTNDGTQGPDAETWTYSGAGTLLSSFGDFTNTVKTVRTDDGRIALWNSAPLFPRITGNSQSVNLYTDATSSISDERAIVALNVFPTTVTNHLMIKAIDAGSTWTISDVQGRVILSGAFAMQGDQSLTLSEIAAGPYFLNVTDKTGTRTARFEKQ